MKRLVCKLFGHNVWYVNPFTEWKSYKYVTWFTNSYCKRCNVNFGGGSTG